MLATLGPVVATFHLLRRLQRHGVPGRAPVVAVPVDRAAAIQAELAGIFAALEPVVEDCRLTVDGAGEEARRTVEVARGQARDALERTSARSARVAASEAAEETARLEGEADRLLQSARAEARRVEEAALARRQQLRDRIISYALSLPGTR